MRKKMRKKMKKILSLVLLAGLLLGAAIPAQANSWGLQGELYQAVSQAEIWDDYTTLSQQVGQTAVMKSRYHHALMTMVNGELQVYSTAVYQPQAKKKVSLSKAENGFTLAYGGDTYTFALEAEGYRLAQATAGEITLTLAPANGYQGRYLARDAQGNTAIFSREITLANFNIDLFPRSLEEVEHLARMHAALDSGEYCLGYWDAQEKGRRVAGIGKNTVPVYSAPFGASAWRAAKGKAAVGLNGEMWLLSSFRNQDGQEYYCIRYDVSQRTQRIGYVERKHIDGAQARPWEETQEKIHVTLETTRETFLTDDPDVSQYPQFTLPKGAQLMCMGLYNEDYAYVSAEVKNGKLTSGGQIVWGFVPLRDLQLMKWGEAAQGAMQQLVGVWEYTSGGSVAADLLLFYPDGTYCTYMGVWQDLVLGVPSSQGTYAVYPYHGAENLYWNDPAYELVMESEDGRVLVRGLSMSGEDSFSITYWEGGGGYERRASDPETVTIIQQSEGENG